MRRTLLVTNDFPPVVGGIQRYLADFVDRLPAGDIEVLAHTPPGGATEHDASSAYPIHRHDARVLLPTTGVARHMERLIRERGIETVWFGAAAPLGLLGTAAKRAGATRVVATTHGHEVGWAIAPPTRTVLRRIFTSADVVTYISEYTKDRLAPLIPAGTALVNLPSGIDTDRFRPDDAARRTLRSRYGVADAPTVVCVSRLVPRKGQDVLIEAWPDVVAQVPGARLVIVGWGSYAKRLAELRRASPVRGLITLTGKVAEEELAGHVALGDVFAMPCRTRHLGADVEGLGIVFLEAAAVGLPVIAGDSGGAPETVVDGVTGTVVDGRSHAEVTAAVVDLLRDPARRAAMGAAGREHMEANWTWPHLVERLREAIDGR
ncbi:MAG TPA: glycosyltransferase family 4 protein [Actinomycetaceae bacterium]|nr:glycosyltransferase family 4 protein [Actinomycetaceae bacterium]